jgi:hypothetical protein
MPIVTPALTVKELASLFDELFVLPKLVQVFPKAEFPESSV